MHVYFYQFQLHLLVTGFQWADFVVSMGTNSDICGAMPN